MKKLLLAATALVLATGAAQAKSWHIWKCQHGIEVQIGVRKDPDAKDLENWRVQYTEIRGTHYDPEKHRIKIIDNPAMVYLNGKRCEFED